MDIDTASADMLDSLLRTRRSVRGFLPHQVPQEVITRALTMAQLAPSNCNVQPWSVHIVGGDRAHALRTALTNSVTSGVTTTPDFPLTRGYQGVYRERQIESAKALFAATGVARGDDDARRRSMLRNSTRRTLRSFSCPAGVVFGRQPIAACSPSH